MSKGVNTKLSIDMKGLKDLEKGVKKKMYAKVGILGEKSARNGEVNNAEIGVVQEFGSVTKNIPARSFLVMPITEKRKQIQKEILKRKKVLEKALEKGDMTVFYDLLGVAAEKAIQQAFDSGGFGKWAPLKVRQGSPLVDTAQLRRSVTSKVVKGDN